MSVSMPTQIRILLVDDHAMVREGLGMALALYTDLNIVGQARGGHEALSLLEPLNPDLLLLDLNMPDLDGIAVTHEVRRRRPQTRILILSGLHADERILAAVEAGINGYIVKDATTVELSQAIRQVAAGESYFHPLITDALVRHARRSNNTPASAEDHLTRREQDVLQLMVTSATNRDIAAALNIAEETVRTHVKRILRKLNQSNRTQAVIEAVRRGLITLDE